MTLPHSERLQFAIDTAHAAGECAMQWFQSNTLVTDGKTDGSPVTQADRAAETLVRERIAAAYPQDGILGEEFPSIESKSGKTWVIDPIDGTMSFVHGVPLFGTLLACMDQDTPTIGVIHMPALKETVAAEIGAGSWWYRNDQPPSPAKVSDHPSLQGAMLLSTSFEYYDNPAHKQAWIRLNDLGAHTRGWSDCYAFLLVATGRAEAALEPAMMKLWDIACVPPIIAEAGGTWTTTESTKDLNHGSMIASNGRVHKFLTQALQHS
ncbi:MAG: inositol monophosphatase family protein [Phycisphaerales bacterium]